MLSIVKDVLTRLYAFLGGDIYYINSGEALPPPLSREEEAKIMEQLRAEMRTSNRRSSSATSGL